MKIIKNVICLLLIICTCLISASCASDNVFLNQNCEHEKGLLSATPLFAYYNNGKEVEELKDIDPEMAAEGIKNDGSFVIYFEIKNDTEFDRKITALDVKFIKNENNTDIVQGTIFDLNIDFYIPSGESRNIPCVFEKEFVLSESRLNTLTSRVGVHYEGCVVNGAEPKEADSGLTASIRKAVFTQADGLEGTYSIRNNNKTDVKLDSILFTLQTNEGVKITLEPVAMVLDTTLGAGEIMTLEFAVAPKNVNDDVKNNKFFDSIDIILK